MPDSRSIGGACLVGAALSFRLAWFLMPMPGTSDVAFILAKVGATPERVWLSVSVQTIPAALFVPGLLAYEMVQPGVARDAMLPLMARFQSADLIFFTPQLLALAIGLGLAVVGGALATATGQGLRPVALSVLALFSFAVAWVGAGLSGASAGREP